MSETKDLDRHGLLSLLYDRVPFWVETGLATRVTVTVQRRDRDEPESWSWTREGKGEAEGGAE